MPYTDHGTGYQRTDTSRAAVVPETKRLRLRDQVLVFLRRSLLPLTTEDLARIMDRPYASIQPRLSELQDSGLARDSGRRGMTRYGRSCIKWEAVPLDERPSAGLEMKNPATD
jgi:hypothetical protein